MHNDIIQIFIERFHISIHENIKSMHDNSCIDLIIIHVRYNGAYYAVIYAQYYSNIYRKILHIYL